MTPEQQIERFIAIFNRIKTEINKVIVGHEDIIEDVLVALFSDGHVLLEGVPGLGKTLLVKSLGQALGLRFKRIQFTPDLMPADVIGTNLVVDEGGSKRFRFQPGPIFANIILADEINRATPKTQSAFLEAMAEGQVTVAGRTYPLERPFFVLATQNPIEMEGTYPLPEAQLDRFFFKLCMFYTDFEGEREIIRRTTGGESYQIQPVLAGNEVVRTLEWMKALVRQVLISSEVEEYVVRLVYATRPSAHHKENGGRRFVPEVTDKYINYGASTRGAQALVLAGKVLALLDGRANVSFEDIDRVLKSALRHRIILNFEAEVEGRSPDDVLEDIRKYVKRQK